jgi:hypothetical protein
LCRWCEYTELERVAKTLDCTEAKVELYASGWALDTHATALLNGWTDDVAVVVRNVDAGMGQCALYK